MIGDIRARTRDRRDGGNDLLASAGQILGHGVETPVMPRELRGTVADMSGDSRETRTVVAAARAVVARPRAHVPETPAIGRA